jgi:hypothetical protein
MPADALRHQRLYLELLNMYDVIHAYKSGQEPTLDKNPYHRMLKYHDQTHRLTEQTWDPTLHPSHYSPVPTVGGILTNLVLTIIGGGVSVLPSSQSFTILSRLSSDSDCEVMLYPPSIARCGFSLIHLLHKIYPNN